MSHRIQYTTSSHGNPSAKSQCSNFSHLEGEKLNFSATPSNILQQNLVGGSWLVLSRVVFPGVLIPASPLHRRLRQTGCGDYPLSRRVNLPSVEKLLATFSERILEDREPVKVLFS